MSHYKKKADISMPGTKTPGDKPSTRPKKNTKKKQYYFDRLKEALGKADANKKTGKPKS